MQIFYLGASPRAPCRYAPGIWRDEILCAKEREALRFTGRDSVPPCRASNWLLVRCTNEESLKFKLLASSGMSFKATTKTTLIIKRANNLYRFENAAGLLFLRETSK